MDKPRSSRVGPSRLNLLWALSMVAACQQPEQDAGLPNAVEEPALNLPSIPRPQPPIDRAGILAAVAQAASASALGTDDSAAQGTLDGRQFEFRIRFGCKGPSNNLRDEWLGWSLDGESRTLRLRAMPTLSAEDRLVGELGGDRFEAVEGFWIPRPWLLEPACPAAAAVSSPPAEQVGPAAHSEPSSAPVPSSPRIGIAQFFTKDEPRTGRRSARPYEAVKAIEPDQPVGSKGFDLVLSGRLRALAGERVIACIARNAESPPECIVSADFDRVWIERPDSREIIAEWGSG